MKLQNILLFLIFPLIIFSCSTQKKKVIKEGTWLGVLEMDKNDKTQLLPFNFSVGKNEIIITNADEKIVVKEITTDKDSIFIKLPVYKDEIKAKIISTDSLLGEYFHYGSKSKYSFPFYAKYGITERFENSNIPPIMDVSGRWETIVQPGDSNQYTIVGEFKQNGNHLTGTFLTPSGDYRFLEGAISGNQFMLSCLEGSFTLLIKATISKDSTLENGIIIGGPTWREKWRAIKNEKIELPDADKLSTVKEGIDKIDFSFPDLNGKMVSLSDEKYKNKVIVVQIMGSWCPNCLDETRFFAEVYDNYKPKGFEIVGLSFESNNFEESKLRIERFVNQIGAKGDYLYAGEAGKKQYSKSFTIYERV